jgi:hypothetical protein
MFGGDQSADTSHTNTTNSHNTNSHHHHHHHHHRGSKATTTSTNTMLIPSPPTTIRPSQLNISTRLTNHNIVAITLNTTTGHLLNTNNAQAMTRKTWIPTKQWIVDYDGKLVPPSTSHPTTTVSNAVVEGGDGQGEGETHHHSHGHHHHHSGHHQHHHHLHHHHHDGAADGAEKAHHHPSHTNPTPPPATTVSHLVTQQHHQHRVSVDHLVLLPKSKIMIGACSDRYLRFWDLETFSVLCSCLYIDPILLPEMQQNLGSTSSGGGGGGGGGGVQYKPTKVHIPSSQLADEVIRLLQVSDSEDMLVGK